MEQRLLLADIAAGLVRRNNMPAREAEAFVRQFFECIGENLFHDNIVKVKSLGTFKVVGVEARESVDVNSGKRITIEGHAKVSFTPDPVLRDAINKPFAEFETVVINENTPLEAMEAIPVQPENVPEDSVTEVTSEEVQQPAEVVEQPRNGNAVKGEPARVGKHVLIHLKGVLGEPAILLVVAVTASPEIT